VRQRAAEQAYVLDLYVHPGCASRAAELYDAAMPSRGQVRTFLRGADRDATTFVLDRGFRLETSLRDDFNHHDPTTPDIRVYGRSVPSRAR
jgi:hypothetical protein